jgi:hypothetical protein
MAEKRRLQPRDEKARTDSPPDLSNTSPRKEKHPINAPVPQVSTIAPVQDTDHAHYPQAHERENNSVQKP